jgi:hypothetical protein
MLAAGVFMIVSSMTTAIYLPRLFLSTPNTCAWYPGHIHVEFLIAGTDHPAGAIVSYGTKLPSMVRNCHGKFSLHSTWTRTETSNAKEVYASRVYEPGYRLQTASNLHESGRNEGLVKTPIQPSKRDDPMSIDPSIAHQPAYMKAARVRQFGAIDAIHLEEIQRPVPAAGQVLVRVHAAGVGPWDAWVRAGRSKLGQPLPLTLGSDISGTVEAVAEGVDGFFPGDAVYGATNALFIGAYAEFAVAEAGMLARKPRQLSHVEAASVPVIACTAWQLVHIYGKVNHAQRVLVHGAAGNVGAYAA